MKFSFLTIFPELIEQGLSQGIVGQAFKNQTISKQIYNPREQTSDVHRSVDDRPFGGGDGMIMLAEPLAKSLDKLIAESETKPVVIYPSPQGQPLNQTIVNNLAKMDHLLFVCGRYGGIDQRFINTYVDYEISIGDYVLSGGELPALVIVDAVARQLPRVLGHDQSAHSDSFSGDWGGLEAPQFTRPRFWREIEVPEIYLGGNHLKQDAIKKALSIVVTLEKRSDLVEKAFLAGQLIKNDFIKAQKDLQEFSESDWLSLGLDQKAILNSLKAWIQRT